MEDRAVSRRKMCCPRRISAAAEEPVQIPEAEESEETEAADGQNRIQNDTEQEEADIADDTTLIFAGDVLFANAFKTDNASLP